MLKPQPPVAKPSGDIECIALVKPGAAPARHWGFEKPTFGIYEYSKALDKHELRFGDRSSQRLIPGQFADVILLIDQGSELVERLFD